MSNPTSAPPAQPKMEMEFQFVNSTPLNPSMPQDLAVRALIRKQAMKKASAARRRDGNYGKHNLRQYPVFVLDEKIACEESGVKVIGTALDGEMVENGNMIVEKKGGEGSWRRRGRKLYGKYTSAARISFFYFDEWTPPKARYGHDPCLSAAVDCVVARARQIISPPQHTSFWEPLVLAHYITALETLQRAIDSPQTCYKPEVLCATEILALYELLEPSDEAAWIRHSAGAARLILLRTPESYTTDFERALFMGHTGPIMTEALLNGERCFLEQSAWQELLMSVICKEEYYTVSDRSEIVVLLIMAKSNIPGTFWDMTQLLCKDEEPRLEYVVRIQKWCRGLRQRFVDWRGRYEGLIREAGAVSEGTMEFDRRAKAYATFLSCIMFANRLLGCVSPGERMDLERETQGLAEEMLELDERVKAASKAADLFMRQTAGVAMAIQGSRRDFEEEIGRRDPGGLRNGFVEKEVFERWCVNFGRKIVIV
ncbi:hypothetical protein NHQ30_003431 [Ciborinia camelliae]|nr:hypothetical protein NHQ30_003431 [Ciborinia camelliae]